MGINGTEFSTAGCSTWARGVGNDDVATTYLVVIDARAPNTATPEIVAAFRNDMQQAGVAFVDSLFEMRSALQHRSRIVVIAVTAGRLVQVTESAALSDTRNRRTAHAQIRLAFRQGQRLPAGDPDLSAESLAAEVHAFAKELGGSADSSDVCGVRVAMFVNACLAGKTWIELCRLQEADRDGGNASTGTMIGRSCKRLMVLLSVHVSGVYAQNQEGALQVLNQTLFQPDCVLRCVSADRALVAAQFSRIIGDLLCATVLLDVSHDCDGAASKLQLISRPRVICSTTGLGSFGSLVQSHSASVSLYPERRVYLRSLAEDTMIGIPHVLTLKARDGASREHKVFSSLVSVLYQQQEALICRVEAGRFAALVPGGSSGTRHALLLRDIACAGTLVPLPISFVESVIPGADGEDLTTQISTGASTAASTILSALSVSSYTPVELICDAPAIAFDAPPDRVIAGEPRGSRRINADQIRAVPLPNGSPQALRGILRQSSSPISITAPRRRVNFQG